MLYTQHIQNTQHTYIEIIIQRPVLIRGSTTTELLSRACGCCVGLWRRLRRWERSLTAESLKLNMILEQAEHIDQVVPAWTLMAAMLAILVRLPHQPCTDLPCRTRTAAQPSRPFVSPRVFVALCFMCPPHFS